jgi:hypothetical protein
VPTVKKLKTIGLDFLIPEVPGAMKTMQELQGAFHSHLVELDGVQAPAIKKQAAQNVKGKKRG